VDWDEGLDCDSDTIYDHFGVLFVELLYDGLGAKGSFPRKLFKEAAQARCV